MSSTVRAVAENAFLTGLFGGLTLGIPLMVLGFGSLGTAVLLIGVFGGLLAETLQSDGIEDDRSAVGAEAMTTDDELATLRQRYVEGEISEAEFERRVEAHLDEDDLAGSTDANLGPDRLETETNMR